MNDFSGLRQISDVMMHVLVECCSFETPDTLKSATTFLNSKLLLIKFSKT